jgi:hypothetical protein
LANIGITIGVGFVGFLLLAFVGLVWANYMRGKYLKETKGKIKGVFISEGATQPTDLILELEPNGMEVKAPFGHHLGTYIVSRSAMRQTMYPEKPFLGLWFVQVPIDTQWWGVGNPEPMYSFKSKSVATADQIFQSRDSSFMFALREAKKELDAERKDLMKQMKGKLNAQYVYIGLVLIIVLAGAAAYLSFTDHSLMVKIAEGVGVAAK